MKMNDDDRQEIMKAIRLFLTITAVEVAVVIILIFWFNL